MSDIFIMDTVLGYEVKEGIEYYQVKWEGYSLAECTWEPVKNILNPTIEQRMRMDELKRDYLSDWNPKRGISLRKCTGVPAVALAHNNAKDTKVNKSVRSKPLTSTKSKIRKRPTAQPCGELSKRSTNRLEHSAADNKPSQEMVATDTNHMALRHRAPELRNRRGRCGQTSGMDPKAETNQEERSCPLESMTAARMGKSTRGGPTAGLSDETESESDEVETVSSDATEESTDACLAEHRAVLRPRARRVCRLPNVAESVGVRATGSQVFGAGEGSLEGEEVIVWSLMLKQGDKDNCSTPADAGVVVRAKRIRTYSCPEAPQLSKKEEQYFTMPLNEFKNSHPQELLVYFIDRIEHFAFARQQVSEPA